MESNAATQSLLEAQHYDSDDREDVDVGDDKDDHQVVLATHPKFKILSILLAFLLIITNVTWALIETTHGNPQPDGRSIASSNGLDDLPSIPKIEMRMAMNDTEWLSENTTVSNALWSSIFPYGNGQVFLPDSLVSLKQNSSRSVKPTDDPRSKDHSVYLLAGLHQLHCLAHVRAILWQLRKGADGPEIPENVWVHTLHCVDAVRQALMCTADTTLLAKPGSGLLPGEGQMKVCADWSAYYGWAEHWGYVFVDGDDEMS